MNKVVAEYNNNWHVCTGHVLCCADTDRSIASFWHESDINNVVEAINNHDKLISERDELIHALESVLADWQVDASFLTQLVDFDTGDSDYLKQSKACGDLINKIKGGE